MEVLVNTYRGDLVDLVTTGSIAVVDSKGNLIYSVGDPYEVAYARSSAKLMQAVVPVLYGAVDEYKINDKEIAQICASHSGEKIHVDTVRDILAKIELNEDYLQCGEHYPFKEDVAKLMKEKDEEPLAVHNNCSGKHAGMLATVKYLNEDLDTYYKANHPHQIRIIEMIGKLCDYNPDDIGIGLDGCGVPVHALPLNKFAYGMARMVEPSSLDEKYREPVTRVVNAVMNNPVYASGSDRIDFKVMEKYPNKVVVKSGANGYFGGAIPDKGIGFAIKTHDGLSPMRNVVLIELLHQLGVIPSEDLAYFDDDYNLRVYNHKKELVGESKAIFKLKKHYSKNNSFI
ncbi:L-asparaginase II [[Clostridium] sordellii]|uniref:L-asparaginase II n=1 Tax=Paraclostridium sordellii TaxID=1505 RepID=A0A0C7R186_PARSO|nr:asparaginase [Paeniclostridium sordellii]CEQ02998.1 L-asparaginase II [[Clostridium] sordellii] [Paeniclostridium sordellii]